MILVSGAIIYRNSRNKKIAASPSPTPQFQQVVSKFPSVKVPQNADRVDLNSVSGGEGIGEAFRTFDNGSFKLTVMANLPQGNYSAWIVNSIGTKILLGKLTAEKGGYIINYSINKDLTSYSKVLVTEGTKNILEGSF